MLFHESRVVCWWGICTRISSSDFVLFSTVLWIRNDLFRIRIQLWIFRVPDPDPGKSSGSNPCYLSIFGNCKQNHLKFNHKKNLSTICHFLFHTTVLQHTKSGIQREITFSFICFFIFCWIRIRNNNFESGSRQKFRIHADTDPDPQHWFNNTVAKENNSCLMFIFYRKQSRKTLFLVIVSLFFLLYLFLCIPSCLRDVTK